MAEVEQLRLMVCQSAGPACCESIIRELTQRPTPPSHESQGIQHHRVSRARIMYVPILSLLHCCAQRRLDDLAFWYLIRAGQEIRCLSGSWTAPSEQAERLVGMMVSELQFF